MRYFDFWHRSTIQVYIRATKLLRMDLLPRIIFGIDPCSIPWTSWR